MNRVEGGPRARVITTDIRPNPVEGSRSGTLVQVVERGSIEQGYAREIYRGLPFFRLREKRVINRANKKASKINGGSPLTVREFLGITRMTKRP